jgi:hypothetical protein
MKIVLRARSNDPGGLSKSFENQLKELNAKKSELLSETDPYRVDSSDAFYFEARREYDVQI